MPEKCEFIITSPYLGIQIIDLPTVVERSLNGFEKTYHEKVLNSMVLIRGGARQPAYF